MMGGIIALLFGAIVIGLHNHWVMEWPIIITLLGWWSLIKGFGLLVYPDFTKIFSFIQNRSDTFYRLISLLYNILGLFLLYKGYLE